MNNCPCGSQDLENRVLQIGYCRAEIMQMRRRIISVGHQFVYIQIKCLKTKQNRFIQLTMDQSECDDFAKYFYPYICDVKYFKEPISGMVYNFKEYVNDMNNNTKRINQN